MSGRPVTGSVNPTEICATRWLVVLLAATCTVSGFDPIVIPVGRVIQPGLSVLAVQEQAVVVSTFNVTCPPFKPTSCGVVCWKL
jgi:hypothetical protein